VPEVIDSEVNGLLLPPKDPQKLADGLERLIRDPELRRRLGEAARQKVLARFDSRQWAADMYRRIFGELPRVNNEVVKPPELLRTAEIMAVA
jgi:glycosyltransferase involved in cell wall biosynthesis